MAYLLDDEEQRKQQQGAQGPEQLTTGPSSGVITPGDSGGQAPAPKAGGNVGGFTNLQQYVTANQGNDAQMGQKVQGVVGDDAQKSDAAVSNYQGAGSQAVDQGTVKWDKGLGNEVMKDPTKVVSDQSKSQAFQRMLTGKYAGPNVSTDVAGYGDAQAANQVVKNDLESARGDNAGRQGLLDKAYGRAGYSQGEKTLDSFLLGAGQGGQQSLNDIQANYGGKANAFEDASSALGQSIANAQQASQAVNTKTQDFLTTVGGQTDNKIAGKAKTLEKTSAGDAAGFQKILSYLTSSDPKLRAEGFQSIGMEPKVGEEYVAGGGDPTKLVTQGTAKGLGDVISPELVARLGALSSLGYGSKYDPTQFAKTGGDGRVFNTTDEVTKAAQAYTKNHFRELMGLPPLTSAPGPVQQQGLTPAEAAMRAAWGNYNGGAAPAAPAAAAVAPAPQGGNQSRGVLGDSVAPSIAGDAQQPFSKLVDFASLGGNEKTRKTIKSFLTGRG